MIYKFEIRLQTLHLQSEGKESPHLASIREEKEEIAFQQNVPQEVVSPLRGADLLVRKDGLEKGVTLIKRELQKERAEVKDHIHQITKILKRRAQENLKSFVKENMRLLSYTILKTRNGRPIANLAMRLNFKFALQ